jgi:DNA-binding NtrC family response regulator
LAAAALARLQEESWPGNVRQLENALEMAIALSGDRGELIESDFPPLENVRLREVSGRLPWLPETGLNYEETLARIERSILRQALRKTGGNKKAAAEMLGLKRTTLSAKVRNLGGVALCG